MRKIHISKMVTTPLHCYMSFTFGLIQCNYDAFKVTKHRLFLSLLNKKFQYIWDSYSLIQRIENISLWFAEIFMRMIFSFMGGTSLTDASTFL